MRRYHLLLLLSIMGSLFTVMYLPGCGLLGIGGESLLEVTPVSATEVVLHVRAGRGERVTIDRGGRQVYRFTLRGGDTLLTDDGLRPATTYTWKAETPHEATFKQTTTLDTTSHRFTWQRWSFGEHSSSSLQDVAILAPDNIWAVGEIYMNDTTGRADPKVYNAVHWDGKQWNLKRISVDFRGNTITLPLEGIQAFSASDMWVVGSLPIHGNGEQWKVFDVRSDVDENLSLWHVWGNNSRDIYFVGRNGSIAHFDGNNWQSLDSGTALNINDIWGARHPDSGRLEILAVASNTLVGPGQAVLQIDGTSVTQLPAAGLPPALEAIWFVPGRRYLIGGDGIHHTEGLLKYWRRDHRLPGLFKQGISGNGLNDVMVVGAFGLVVHYNGATWHDYMKLRFDGAWTSVQQQGDLAVIVGGKGAKASILMGRRK